MPYSITTKDGITINNIPDDVPADSPELKARVASIRAGQQPESKTTESARVEIGGVPIFAESAKARTITPPEGFQLLSAKLVDTKPSGSYYDET
jgi:hypothetical protein